MKIRLIQEVKEGVTGTIPRQAKIPRKLTARDVVKVWMESYFSGLTEQMPMCENMHGGTKRHLPAWMTHQFVFEQFKEEMSARGEGDV